MLYTIIPLSEIFKTEDTSEMNNITMENTILQVDKTGQIQRLISTDPADYLNPSYQPYQPYQK